MDGLAWTRFEQVERICIPDYDPDTILVAYGEKATDMIRSLCAFDFSHNSPSAPAGQANRRQFWPRRGDYERTHILIVPS